MGGFGGGGFGSGGFGEVTTPFPATLRKPSIGIQVSFTDPAIRSKMENGLVFSRPRTSKVNRTWSVVFNNAPQSDADLISDFVQNTSIGGSMAFLWFDPRTGEEVPVRFAKLPQIADAGWATQKDDTSVSGLSYNISFDLEEV